MNEELDTDLPQVDELSSLKSRADLLGIAYHPSIGLEKLRAKVNAAVAGEPEVAEASSPAAATAEVKETESQFRYRLRQEANRLVRIRVACMNPAKKEWEGEIFSVGNSLVGSITKYVPFNAEDGWHVPHILLEMIQDRQCQIFVTTKNASGVKGRTGKLIKEFAVEILPDLTPDELQELAQRQALSKSID